MAQTRQYACWVSSGAAVHRKWRYSAGFFARALKKTSGGWVYVALATVTASIYLHQYGCAC